MELVQDVKEILERLNRAGHEAYAVGGCVRDKCLGKEPHDWDITTSALPEEVKALFRRTLDTGLKHGTVTILLSGTGYEVTTYRVDGKYSDGRHPDEVIFTRSLEEDLKRRDFTINAMACGADGKIVDLFGGREDLSRGIIRCVGDPDLRFSEDALRLLRAVRFSAQLGFTVEKETFSAFRRHREALGFVSRERVFEELNKTLLSDWPERLDMVYETGLDREISPWFAGTKADRRLAALPKERYLRWAAALSGRSGEEINCLLRDLKCDNETRERAVLLVSSLGEKLPGNRCETRKLLSEIGPERSEDLLKLYALGFGTDPDKDGPGQAEELRAEADRVREEIEEILSAGECFSLKQLAVSGRDLIAEGVPAGPELGQTLKRLLGEVIRDPKRNTKETLLECARAFRDWKEGMPGDGGDL